MEKDDIQLSIELKEECITKMKEIERLHQKGVITDFEYIEKTADILKEYQLKIWLSCIWKEQLD